MNQQAKNGAKIIIDYSNEKPANLRKIDNNGPRHHAVRSKKLSENMMPAIEEKATGPAAAAEFKLHDPSFNFENSHNGATNTNVFKTAISVPQPVLQDS